MKLDSKYFDRIRIRRRGEQPRAAAAECEHPGCRERGLYMAPKGRGREGQYYRFCLAHVRDYNKSYNYFNGMTDEEVGNYRKESVTGHRPTWSSLKGWTHERVKAAQNKPGYRYAFETADPFDLFDETLSRGPAQPPRRPIRNAERRSLRALDLDETASAADIKANFKMLVKRHHPDRHGGDRACEEKLREVISAYNYLKQAGLC